MITPAQLYWITRLDAVGHLLTSLVVVAALSPLFLGLIGAAMVDIGSDDATKAKGRRLLRLILPGIVIAVLSAVLNAFVPTTKEMAAIVVIPRVANSETVQQLGKGVVDLANQWLVELAPKHGEGGADNTSTKGGNDGNADTGK